MCKWFCLPFLFCVKKSETGIHLPVSGRGAYSVFFVGTEIFLDEVAKQRRRR